MAPSFDPICIEEEVEVPIVTGVSVISKSGRLSVKVLSALRRIFNPGEIAPPR